MHDPVVPRYRYLDVFRRACYLEARTPHVRLRDGRVALVEPGWAGKLSGFTLLLEAMVVMLARQMPLPRRPAPSVSRAPECTTVCYASTCGPHGVASGISARMLILHLNIISTLREFNLIPTSVHRLANGTPACAQIMNCVSKIYKRIFLKDCQIPGGKNMKLVFDPSLRFAYKKQTFYQRESDLRLCLAPVDTSHTASVLCGTAGRRYADGARAGTGTS